MSVPGPSPPIPPLIGADPLTSFPNVASFGDSEHQLFIAWHALEHTLKRKNVRQVNRVRIYGSQLFGAVR